MDQCESPVGRAKSTDKYDLFTIYWWLQFTKFRAGLLSPRPRVKEQKDIGRAGEKSK